MPVTLAEAAQHQAVLPSYVDMGTVTFTRNGETETLQLTSQMRSSSTLMLRKLIQAGSGIGYMPEWLVANDLSQGSLVRLLPDYEMPPIKLYAAYVDRTFLSAKVRSFIDFMVEKMQ